jgi:hypothetical protein
MPKLTPDGPSIYSNCGKPAAYYKHLRHGTQTCRKCKDAIAAKMDTYRHESGINKSRFVPDTVIQEHGIRVKA